MSIDIRIPDLEETPLSSDEILVAIRDGVEPVGGRAAAALVVVRAPRSFASIQAGYGSPRPMRGVPA